jgi:ribonucleoside-diphosphate reductase alpha chain
LVADSIEGWADAVKVLLKSYFFGGSHVTFDFSDIRPKGARLVTSGGKAPGPQPLKECLIKLEGILESKEDGEKLRPIEVHDMVCHIADAVLAGGIRRAALISLFSASDDEMISCKSGSWWEKNPQRGRANNSVALLRHKITKDYFMDLWKRIEASGAGEPGIYLTNDKGWGTNPCCEIALRPFQFCNLVEINVSNVTSQEDYEERVKAATFIATLQAGYTDFHYLRPIWQRTTEKDALIGISMTGIGSGVVLNLDMKSGAKVVKEENERVAELIGINKAARTTTVKPAGTTSLTLGTSSGIHAWHNDYYIRRVRVGKNETIYTYLAENHPELVEDEYFRPHDTAVIGIPQKAPEGSILRTESPIQLLERVKKVHSEWIKPGHRSGSNTHNVSATISIREHEWPAVGEWMWSNRDYYNGLSVLNYDGGSYIQAPFTDCTKEDYEKLMETLKDVDLSKIVELDDNTNLMGEIACGSAGCEIK